jgi:molybdate transport system ATP-binding protein
MIIDNGKNIQLGTKNEIINTPANLNAARITGCKNFLDVSVLEETDNYFVLQAKELVFKSIKPNIRASKHMIAGIRAHYISLYSIDSKEENTFACDIVEKIEGVFSTTIVVNCYGCLLQVEISKASCPIITESSCKKLKLHIPPEKVFLIEKNN